MKIILTFAVIFLTFVAVSFAADCTVGGVGLNKGQSFSPRGQCIKVTCDGRGRTSAINCAYAPTPPGCRYVPEDPRKPYPQCCSRNIC